MPDLAIEADCPAWGGAGSWEPLLRRAVDGTLAELGIERSGPGRAEVSVLLTGDAAIARLNAAWRGKNRPTNILSFAMLGPAEARAALEGRTGAALLGDLVLAHDTIAAEAEAAGIALADHVVHLFVHGMLHLLGHDHEEEAPAAAMEALETAILARLSIADPYRADAPGAGPGP
jgi:probable rRNA maturation factor